MRSTWYFASSDGWQLWSRILIKGLISLVISDALGIGRGQFAVKRAGAIFGRGKNAETQKRSLQIWLTVV